MFYKIINLKLFLRPILFIIITIISSFICSAKYFQAFDSLILADINMPKTLSHRKSIQLRKKNDQDKSK